MVYDPSEHKPTKPYDEADNPDPESDDDVFENLSTWGAEHEEGELDLASNLEQQSTISNSPPPDDPEAGLGDLREEDSSLEEDEVPWETLEDESVDEMAEE